MTTPSDNADRPAGADTGAPAARRVPAARMRVSRDDRRMSGAISVLFHVLVVVLILDPIMEHDQLKIIEQSTAKGAGPAGGGGGGRRGTGGVTDLKFVRVQPAPAPAPKPVVPTPPVPPPVIAPPPPAPVKLPDPVVEVPKVEIPKIEMPPASVMSSMVTGVGGGSGRDGSRGDGPGSGGGVGSGVGTGRGSGVGPGTGGGGNLDYSPPSLTEMFVPPLPTPSNVRGTRVVVEFDVDSTGRVIGDPKFTKTRNDSYNKRLLEVFRSFRFRPAVRFDGRPIRAPVQLTFEV